MSAAPSAARLAMRKARDLWLAMARTPLLRRGTRERAAERPEIQVMHVHQHNRLLGIEPVVGEVVHTGLGDRNELAAALPKEVDRTRRIAAAPMDAAADDEEREPQLHGH